MITTALTIMSIMALGLVAMIGLVILCHILFLLVDRLIWNYLTLRKAVPEFKAFVAERRGKGGDSA